MTHPPAGWYPNPDPNDQARHRYWDGSQWTEHFNTAKTTPKRSRWKWVLLWTGVAIAAAPVALFVALMVGGFAIAVFTGDSCAFDPPPGDVSTMALENDTSSPVEFVECNNASCSEFNHVGDGNGDRVAPGQADRYWNHENCTREPVGIRDTSGALLGCIVLPADDPPKVTTWSVSQRVPCTGPIG